jgi:hypothetical protein
MPTAAVKPPSQQTIIDKLFTDHDVFHFHKILGFSVMLSSIYRFTQAGASDMNFGPNWQTLFTMLLHLSLNLSSFIFEIPQRRIKDGDRIWPEYRIHSLVFACRSLACMFLLWCEQMLQVESPLYLVNLLIVLGTCAAADYGTALQGEFASRTIRDVKVPEIFPAAAMKFFMSAFQLIGTAHCLVGTRRYSFQLVTVFTIQTTAFVLTLRRKNVASNLIVGVLYGGFLLSGLIVLFLDDYYEHEFLVTGTIGHIAIILRLGPLHLNKYLLWTSLGLGLHYIRSTELVVVKNNMNWFVMFAITAVGAHIGTLIWSIKRQEKKEKEV